MKVDITLALFAAYTSLLKGKVSYKGSIVPVYDAYGVPDTAEKPYILLSSVADVGQNTKDHFGYLASFQVDVVTGFAKGVGSIKQAATIASAICGLLEPTPGGTGLVLDGYYVITTVIDARPLSTQTPTETIIRRILTITHLITE